jgi:ABC-2 type transport system ATP-binding protein
MDAIVVSELRKRYGDVQALDGVSFAVREGEVFGLLGPNGAGKSTTVRVLVTLTHPDSGSAAVNGHDVTRKADTVRRSIGYVPQDSGVDQYGTGRENLMLQGRVQDMGGSDLQMRVDQLLELVGIADAADRIVKTYSGGMRRRLDIALGLVHRPRVLFLDEPTGGVDPVSRRSFWTLIDALAEDGVSIIVTTHYLDEAEHCAQVALMHAGKLVAVGDVASLKEVFAGRAVLEVRCPRPLEAMDLLETEDWVFEVAVFGTSLHLVVGDAAEGERRAAAILEREGLAPAAFERIVPSLEDVFIHYIEREEGGPPGGARP